MIRGPGEGAVGSNADVRVAIRFVAAQTANDICRNQRISYLSISNVPSVSASFNANAGFLCGDQSKGGPVEVAIPARNAGHQTVSHDFNGWHGNAGIFRFGKRQANILERERQHKARRVGLPDEPVPVVPVNGAPEHRIRHDIDKGPGLQSPLAEQRNNFPKHLERGRRHHVAK